MTGNTRASKALCAALEKHLAGGAAQAPEGSSPLWNAFMALSRARSCGPAGPNPIAYTDIAAWAQLMRVPLEPRHVETIAAMDQVWLEHVYTRKTVPEGAKPLPPRSKHKVTAELFDLAVG